MPKSDGQRGDLQTAQIRNDELNSRRKRGIIYDGSIAVRADGDQEINVSGDQEKMMLGAQLQSLQC